MKYSYPDSLITLAAAVTQACPLHINNKTNSVGSVGCNDSTFLKLNTNNLYNNSRVGINFDNILAGKYFVLINRTQRYYFESKALRMKDKVPAECNVTIGFDFIGVLGRNESSVMCQSTFH